MASFILPAPLFLTRNAYERKTYYTNCLNYQTTLGIAPTTVTPDSKGISQASQQIMYYVNTTDDLSPYAAVNTIEIDITDVPATIYEAWIVKLESLGYQATYGAGPPPTITIALP